MDASLEKSLNDQIKHELDSAHLYLAMAAHFEAENLPGFARWMQLQSNEERGHAMRIYQHLSDRGVRVALSAIDAPPASFGSPLSIFEAALEHEKKITGLIHSLYAQALQVADYPAQVMLQWFVEEQVEEEKNAGDAVHQLRLIDGNPAGLMMMDRQLAARTGE